MMYEYEYGDAEAEVRYRENRQMTKKHLEDIKAWLEDPEVREVLLDGLAKNAFDTEIEQSRELGPNWPAGNKKVDNVRKVHLRNAQYVADAIKDGLLEATGENLETLSQVVDMARLIENDADAMVLADDVDRLKALGRENLLEEK